METQAYFENIRDHIKVRLTDAEHSIDLAVAWFTDRVLFDALCRKAKSGVKVRLLLFDEKNPRKSAQSVQSVVYLNRNYTSKNTVSSSPCIKILNV